MSLTLQELVDRAVSIATAGFPPELSAALNTEMIAEDLLPSVFTKVAGEQAANSSTRSLLRRTKVISTIGGAVTLSGDVLNAYMCDSNLLDPTDKTKQYAFITNWPEFIGEDAGPLGTYCIEGEDSLHIVEPNATYDPAGGANLSYLLTVPCVPIIPTTPTGVIGIIDELDNDLIEALAEGLKAGVKAIVSAAKNT